MSLKYVVEFDFHNRGMAGRSTEKGPKPNVNKRHTTAGTKENVGAKGALGKENRKGLIPLPESTKSLSPRNPTSRNSRALKCISTENQPQPLMKGAKPPVKQVRMSASFKVYSDEGKKNSQKKDSVKNTPSVTPSRLSRQVMLTKKRSSSPEFNPPSDFCQCPPLADESQQTSSSTIKEMIEKDMDRLIELFPNVDRVYLKSIYEKEKGPLEEVIHMISTEVAKGRAPSMETFQKRLSVQLSEARYMKSFTIEKILKIKPDPWAYFESKRKKSVFYSEHSLYYLKKKFCNLYTRTISDALRVTDYNLYLAYTQLKSEMNKMHDLRKKARTLKECDTTRPYTVRPDFLFEVAFIENEEAIRDYLYNQKRERIERIVKAKRLGFLVVCESCEVGFLNEDTLKCPKGHSSCKECVMKSIETQIEKGSIRLGCLGTCKERYSLELVEDLVSSEKFRQILDLADCDNWPEIMELRRCPFCSFVRIKHASSLYFECLDPSCLMITCRACKQVHDTYRGCNEPSNILEVKPLRIKNEKSPNVTK